MENIPNHKDIISNSVAGYINSNIDENNMPEVLLSGNLKTNYTCKNFNKNGWYVKKLNSAQDRLAVDELQQEMKKVPFKSRKVWNQVFNTISNTSTLHETLRASFGDTTKVDAGRTQVFISNTESKGLQTKATNVGTLLKYQILDDLRIRPGIRQMKKKPKLGSMVLTALETEPPMVNPITGILDWVPNQLLHSDTDPTLEWKSDSFIGLIATNPGTTYVRVITGSHLMSHNGLQNKKYCIHVIALQQYEYFVSFPTLIHGGASNIPREEFAATIKVTRQQSLAQRTEKGGKSSLIEGDPAGTEFLEKYRNTRLHFYYNLPSKATLTTFFYTDALAAPLLLEDRSKRNLEPVRHAIKVNKRKIVQLQSRDTVSVYKKQAT
jgi:hypothetical protein